MAKNKKNNYEVNEFDEALVASKSFFEKNKKTIVYGGGALLAIVIAALLIHQFYLVPRSQKANESLFAAQELFMNGEYEKAYWELQKVVDLIISTYQVDHYSEMIDIVKQKNFTQEGCKFAANAIYEIYTDVVNRPRRQYQTDNRTNSVQLV